MAQAYEIHNPSFPDLTLEAQISYGCSDWGAEDANGHVYVGRTKEEAENARASFKR